MSADNIMIVKEMKFGLFGVWMESASLDDSQLEVPENCKKFMTLISAMNWAQDYCNENYVEYGIRYIPLRQNCLTKRQQAHLDKIKAKVYDMIDVKYKAGAKEHGGCLEDLSEAELLKELRAELIDGLTYMAALELKMEGNK